MRCEVGKSGGKFSDMTSKKGHLASKQTYSLYPVLLG